jgi:phage-related protein
LDRGTGLSELEFYQDEDGDKPVAAFLREIDRSNPRLAARVRATIERLKHPSYRGRGHTTDLGGGLFEVRVLGQDGVRILFFYAERRIILVHAFVKKTQRLPPAERRIAEERRRRFKERVAAGTYP